MIDRKLLIAVDVLPGVGAAIRRRRDGILNLMASARDLRRRAELIEGQAQQAYDALERRIHDIWTPEQVRTAQSQGGRSHAAD